MLDRFQIGLSIWAFGHDCPFKRIQQTGKPLHPCSKWRRPSSQGAFVQGGAKAHHALLRGFLRFGWICVQRFLSPQKLTFLGRHQEKLVQSFSGKSVAGNMMLWLVGKGSSLQCHYRMHPRWSLQPSYHQFHRCLPSTTLHPLICLPAHVEYLKLQTLGQVCPKRNGDLQELYKLGDYQERCRVTE